MANKLLLKAPLPFYSTGLKFGLQARNLEAKLNEKMAGAGRSVTSGDRFLVMARKGKYVDAGIYQPGQADQINGNTLDVDTKRILQAEAVGFDGENISFRDVTQDVRTQEMMERGAAEGENVAEVSKDHFAGEYKLKPNVEYTSNGYSYATNENGCIVRAAGNLVLGKGQRNKSHQIKAGGNDRLSTDHGGHLIAVIFDGSPLIDNIVAMDGNINLSEYKRLEKVWKSALLRGEHVYVNIDIMYTEGSTRPDAFKISYEVSGKRMPLVYLKNKVGG